MLINATIDKLQTLSLGGMARALEEQLASPGYVGLSFEERLGLLDRPVLVNETANGFSDRERIFRARV